MKVKCVLGDIHDNYDQLKEGKIYEVVEEREGVYLIRNEYGNVAQYKKSCFIGENESIRKWELNQVTKGIDELYSELQKLDYYQIPKLKQMLWDIKLSYNRVLENEVTE